MDFFKKTEENLRKLEKREFHRRLEMAKTNNLPHIKNKPKKVRETEKN